MFHIELRQSFHNLNRFNLQEPEMLALALPWAQERPLELGERVWSPYQAKLRILEGPQLSVGELSMGRGWRAALRRSEDVTEQVLARIRAEVGSERPPAPAPEPATKISLTGPSKPVHRPAPARPVAPPVPAAVPLAGSQESHGASSAQDVPTAEDPLALDVGLAALLGADAASLLAAWRRIAARAPGLSPSESLALAEREIGGHPPSSL